VSRIYTELAVLDVTAEGLRVRESVAGLAFEVLQARTGVPLLRR
jgi:3-oxoadipate CoA-transferase beta subunit